MQLVLKLWYKVNSEDLTEALSQFWFLKLVPETEKMTVAMRNCTSTKMSENIS